LQTIAEGAAPCAHVGEVHHVLAVADHVLHLACRVVVGGGEDAFGRWDRGPCAKRGGCAVSAGHRPPAGAGAQQRRHHMADQRPPPGSTPRQRPLAAARAACPSGVRKPDPRGAAPCQQEQRPSRPRGPPTLLRARDDGGQEQRVALAKDAGRAQRAGGNAALPVGRQRQLLACSGTAPLQGSRQSARAARWITR
jgi:hypothetical protein